MNLARGMLSAGLFVVTLVVGMPTSGFAQTAEDDGQIGLEMMLECLADTQHLATVVLVDESSSLRQTDAGNQRVDMVDSLVDALQDISRVTLDGLESQLDIAIVGFSSDVRGASGNPASMSDWVTVSPEKADLLASVVLGFAERNRGPETDYVTALVTAQDLLIQRLASVDSDQEICTSILWFTDGKFDLEVNNQSRPWTADLDLTSDAGSMAGIDRGTDLLCRPGGIADQLRSSSTYLLTFALLSDRFTDGDDLLLRKVTLGVEECGEIDGSMTGSYFAGEVPDGMADCFYLALQGHGCPHQPDESVQCAATGPCVRTFDVDDSITSVRLEFSALPNLDDVYLRSPSGSETPLNDDDVLAMSGASVRVNTALTAGFATLEFAEGDAEPHGTWSVVNRVDGPGSLDVTARATPVYRLAISVPDEVVRGQPFELAAVITGSSGAPIDPQNIDKRSGVTFTVDDGGNSVEFDVADPDSEGTFVTTVTLATELSSLEVEVSARLDVETAAALVRLESPKRSVATISPGHIRMPATLDFGFMTAERAADSDKDHSQVPLPVFGEDSLTLDAPRDIGGEACFGEPTWVIAQPTLTLGIPNECIRLEPGASVDVPFSLRFDEPQAGQIAAVLPVVVTSDLDGSTRNVDVEITGQIRIPPPQPWQDESRTWWLLAIGILLPVGLYALASIRTSRFNEPTVVQVSSYSASITPSGLELGPSVTAALSQSEFAFLDGNERKVTGGGLTLTAPRRAIRQPVARVESASATYMVSSSEHSIRYASTEIGHEIGGHWVFTALGATGNSVMGEFVVFTRESGTDAHDAVSRARTDAGLVLMQCQVDLIALLSDQTGQLSADSTETDSASGSTYKW